MPFYVYAWLALLSASLTVIITKLTGKYSIKNVWYFNFLWTLVTLLFTIPVALANHAQMPRDWLPLIIAAVFAALWNIFYILSMYLLDVSTLSPLFNLRTVFALFFGSFLLNEHLGSTQLLYVGVILVAGVFATIDERMNLKSFFKPAVGIGILAMLFLALNNVFIKIGLIHNELYSANLWMAIINTILLVPTIPLFIKDLKGTSRYQLFPVFLMGIFQMFTNIVGNIAYRMNVGVTSLIMSIPLSMIIVFFLSRLKPNLLEKHTLNVYIIRFSAALLMIFCAIKITQ